MTKWIILILFALPALAADHYVDCAAAPGGDGSLASPWNTVAQVNGHVFVDDDFVYFKRGCTWAAQLTPGQSGTSGHPITFSAYGAGTLPIIAGGTQSILVSSRNYLTFSYLSLKAVQVTGAGLILHHCLQNMVVGNALYINAGSEVTANHIAIVGSTLYAVSLYGTLTLRNSTLVGNGASSYNTIRVQSTGVLDYDYNLISGTSYWPLTVAVLVTAGGVATDGGHNSTRVPGWAAYNNDTAYFVASSDDHDVAYWQAVAATAPIGAKWTFFAVSGSIGPGEYATLAGLATAGHEVASHTRTHAGMTSTYAFAVTTTNASPTVTVDVAGHTITLSTTTPGNTVVLDWAGDKTIADLRTATTGKAWTLTNSVHIYDSVFLRVLADSGGPQAAPYDCLLDAVAFRASEIDDSIVAIQGMTGIAPITLAWPWGENDAAVQTYARDYGLIAARGTTLNTPTRHLAIVSAYNVLSLSYATWVGNGSEATIRLSARNLFTFAKTHGVIVSLLVHDATEATATQMGWLMDEVQTIGGQWITFAQAMALIRADHATADGLTYTKTYPNVSDYRLLKGSAAIYAGENLGAAYDLGLDPRNASDVQALSRVWFGWDIGPYVRIKRKAVGD